jgi:hypothetical protein
MAKRSSLTGGSSLNLQHEVITPKISDSGVDIEPDVFYTNSNRVSVRLRLPARYIRVGPVSGERYEWDYAGSSVDVLSEDVDGLLSLKMGEGACCGGQTGPFFLFELA